MHDIMCTGVAKEQYRTRDLGKYLGGRHLKIDARRGLVQNRLRNIVVALCGPTDFTIFRALISPGLPFRGERYAESLHATAQGIRVESENPCRPVGTLDDPGRFVKCREDMVSLEFLKWNQRAIGLETDVLPSHVRLGRTQA